ncbi:hypothetical protein B0H13DRAFT_2361138 [Mycena leptocephala]|nr:hypothetical protein B0H13DRAFT_2361138 [Mycena leptocephala]
MTTHQNPVRAMGIFKCPAAISMDIFTQKLEALMHAIVALPCSENISKYDLSYGSVSLTAPWMLTLERLGMPSPQGTIVVTVEFQTVAKMDALLFDPQLKGLVEGAKSDISWHLDSCTFAYDKITKINN